MTILHNDDTKKNQIKILLIGLDNSGKTSILTCLKGIKNISSFSALRPTRGAAWENFKALNKAYVVVDFGGQRAFRDGYFNDFTNLLTGTNKIIYVIDVQDTKRYNEALEYMHRVINQITNPNSVDFSVFLHKFDSDFEFNEKDVDLLIRKIKQVTPPNFNYSVHKTSIYATFEKTMLS
ncbi:MAG: ADP-ribosylation factor-like protein [Promethearchaeota archaeon]|jgi:GTPase SAR1 family protein